MLQNGASVGEAHLACLTLIFQGLFGLFTGFLYMIYGVHHVELYIIYNFSL